MGLAAIGSLLGLMVIGLMGSGVLVGVALGAAGIAAYVYRGGWDQITAVGYLTFNTFSSYDFVALPLFIFMASILSCCGLSSRIFNGCAALFSRLPGGLLHVNIGGSALFSSISGSTAATCAAMASISLPELRRRNYPERIALGSLAAGGTLGPMIPPSIAMILYGVITNVSIGQLFIAGIIPGLLLSVLFMCYIAFYGLIYKDEFPVEARIPLRRALADLLSIWPIAVLFAVVVGTIYTGVCTAVESAAVGCAGALLVAALYSELTPSNLMRALREATSITVMIFLVLLGGIILGHGFSDLGIPQALIEATIAADLSLYQFLFILCLVYILLGCFLDGAAVIVVTVPLIFPVITAMGIDPLWFGIIMVIFIEMAAITPPVGVNLFVMQGVSGKPLSETVKGVWPFVLILVIAFCLFTAVPDLVTYLPRLMYS